MASTTDDSRRVGVADPPAPVPRRHGAFPVKKGRLALETLSAAVIAWVYAAVVYRIWDLRWAVPLYEDGSDTRFTASQLKTIDETGWWVHNPHLNYPFGQFHADFPFGGESLQLFALKLLMWVTPGSGQAINLYYLGGFGVLAAVTFLVVRHLRFPFPIALVVAVVYTFLPYHFAHQTEHLYRSTYFSAPLAGLLLLWTLSWRTSFLADPDPAPGTRYRSNLRRGRVLAAVGLAVVIGITETMTTSFTMALLGASAIVTAVRWREPQRLVVAGLLIVVVAGSFLAVSSPTLVRIAEHGKNPTAGVRQIADSESFGLKLSRLVFPGANHRLGVWGKQGARVQQGSTLPTDGGQYIGFLGIGGFITALVLFLGRGLRRAGPRDLRPVEDRAVLMDHASLLIVLCFLLGTVAGFSTVLGVLGFSQVRTWGRIVMLLALMSFLVVSIGAERFGRVLERRGRRPAWAVALATLAVIAFALWDQVTPQPRDYPKLEASWVNDERFVNAIEERMPAGSAIFQLPVVPYPENPPVNGMLDYDLLRGYNHDDGSLRWSYGGVKGRPIADWQGRVDPVKSLPALLGLGYDGLWIDTYGYTDGGADIRAKLQRATRAKPLVSENRRLLFFDLRDYKQRLGRSDAELAAAARQQFGMSPPNPLP